MSYKFNPFTGELDATGTINMADLVAALDLLFLRLDGSNTPSEEISWNGNSITDIAYIGFNNGDETTPSITFRDDLNTGFYAIGADEIGVTVGGSTVLDIGVAGITVSTGIALKPEAVSGQDLGDSGHVWDVFGLLQAPDGLAGTPSISFASDPDTGFYSVGGNEIGLSIGGNLTLYGNIAEFVLSSGLAFKPADAEGQDLGDTAHVWDLYGVLKAPAGLVGTPSVSFFGDLNTGFYNVGADQIGVATNGALIITFNTTQLLLADATQLAWSDIVLTRSAANTLQLATGDLFIPQSSGQDLGDTTHTWDLFGNVFAPAGLVGTPSISFHADTNTGFYSVAGDQIGVSTNGVLRMTFNTTQLLLADATQLAWSDVILSRSGANVLTLASGDALKPADASGQDLGDSTHVWDVFGLLQAPAGAVGTPSISFAGDTNSGFYSVSGDQIGVATNGVLRATFNTTQLLLADTTALAYSDISLSRGAANILQLAAGDAFRPASASGQDLGDATHQWDVFGQIYVPAGSVTTPSVALIGETNTGFYFDEGVLIASLGSQAVYFTSAGTQIPNGATFGWSDAYFSRPSAAVMQLVGSAIIRPFASGQDLGDTTHTWDLIGNVFAPAGLVGTPSHSFHGDLNTGFYSVGADQIGVSTNGVLRMTFNTTQLLLADATLLAWSDVSLSRSGANVLTLASGDAFKPADASGQDLGDSTHVWDVFGQIYAPNGALSTPSIAFAGDVDNGLYYIGSDNWALVAGGVSAIALTATTVTIGDALSLKWSDVSLSRSGADVLTLASGDAFKPADASGQDLGDSTHIWDLFAGSVNIKTGSSTFVKAGGTLSANATPVGNVGAGTDDLITYTMPAGTMGTDGDFIQISAGGTLANNANTKIVALRFDGTAIASLTSTGAPGSVLRWSFQGTVIRKSSTAQAFSGVGIKEGANPISVFAGQLTSTMANAIVVKMTGDATSDNDVYCEYLTVNYYPAP